MQWRSGIAFPLRPGFASVYSWDLLRVAQSINASATQQTPPVRYSISLLNLVLMFVYSHQLALVGLLVLPMSSVGSDGLYGTF
jgi:hypothetical protein